MKRTVKHTHRLTVAVALAAACWLASASRSHASPPPTPSNADTTGQTGAETADQLFSESVRALEQGAPSDAIARLELLADRGVTHPDASFNRGLAYLSRARSQTAVPGDYGRAVAGFTEALALRPGDASADQALAAARAELEKQRARTGASTSIESPPLSSAVVALLSEQTWAALALTASLLATLGLALVALTRRGSLERPASAWRLTGAVLAGVGALFLASTATGAWLAHRQRTTESVAVVVVQNARRVDEEGRLVSGPPIAEGTTLRVLETKGQLALVRSGQSSTWLRSRDLQTISTQATAPSLSAR